MKSINELTKESMLIRTSDPVRAKVLKMLIGDAKKLAKEAQREATEEDLLATARKQLKETENAIGLIRQGGGDTSEYEAEVVVLKSFLPPVLDEAASQAAIEKVLAALPAEERSKKSMGKIMAQLKAVEGLDMKLASALLGKLLA